MKGRRPSRASDESRPLVCHIVFRFDYGGLENGIVNLINGLATEDYRHAVIALTEASEFGQRITRRDVAIHALGKRPGKDPRVYLRLLRLLRALNPDVVHTRNVGTIDCALVACISGVRMRVHGEHGWDVHDPDGESRKYLAVRRFFGRWVSRFVTVSDDLQRWLVRRVGVPANKVTHICNGVDTVHFAPRLDTRARLPADVFPPGCVIFGTVTRFSPIKDPLNLVHAFISAQTELGASGVPARLLMAGNGELRSAAQEALVQAGCGQLAWLPGSRDDVAELLAAMDVFVLGSLREGISNTILEAMSVGLPVIASETGGNVELVLGESTGLLVPPGDPAALARAMVRYGREQPLRDRHGAAARRRAVEEFSLDRMVVDYDHLYRELIGQLGDRR